MMLGTHYDSCDVEHEESLCEDAIESLVSKGEMTKEDGEFLNSYGEPPGEVTPYYEEFFENVDMKKLNTLWDLMVKERHVLEGDELFVAIEMPD